MKAYYTYWKHEPRKFFRVDVATGDINHTEETQPRYLYRLQQILAGLLGALPAKAPQDGSAEQALIAIDVDDPLPPALQQFGFKLLN